MLASNKVDGSAIAYIDETGVAAPITASGALTVSASDGSGVYSNVKLVSSSIVTSDGGTGTLDQQVAQANGSPKPSFTSLPQSGGVHDDQTLAYGDTVLIGAGYDTPDYTVGAQNPATTQLAGGDVIADGATLYRYTGAGGAFDLADDAAILADPTDFLQIGGQEGQTYEYMGPPADTTQTPPYSGASVDLYNTDYANLAYWKLVPVVDVIPSGLKTPTPSTTTPSAPAAETGGAGNVGATSNDSSGAAKPSSATAVGGVLVLNDDRSATQAYILNAAITADSVAVSAIDSATISAVNDSTVVAQTSTLGSGSDLALNGIIATNLVQNSATADVTSSTLSATDPATPPTSGADAPTELSIVAQNDATIDAINDAQTSGGGKAAGIILAFNTIGYQSSNFLFNAVDALLGNTEVTGAFGASPTSDVSAYAQDSTLDATDGSVAITATLSARIDALTTNETSSLGAALENASSTAIGAILAKNATNSTAQAYVTGGSVSAGGDVTIAGADKSSIDAVDNQVVSSVLQGTSVVDDNLLESTPTRSSRAISSRPSPAYRW